MEIELASIGIQDAASIIEKLSAIGQVSMEREDLPAEYFASLFELTGRLAAAIRKGAEAIARR